MCYELAITILLGFNVFRILVRFWGILKYDYIFTTVYLSNKSRDSYSTIRECSYLLENVQKEQYIFRINKWNVYRFNKQREIIITFSAFDITFILLLVRTLLTKVCSEVFIVDLCESVV